MRLHSKRNGNTRFQLFYKIIKNICFKIIWSKFLGNVPETPPKYRSLRQWGQLGTQFSKTLVRKKNNDLRSRFQMVQISIAPRKDGHFWEVDDQIQRPTVVSGGLYDV